MKQRVAHMVPVFAVTRDPGWLVLARKKSGGVTSGFAAALHDMDGFWDRVVKAWFVRNHAIEAAIDAMPMPTVICASCGAGKPCEAWGDTTRHGYLIRTPSETSNDAYLRIKIQASLMEWWQAAGMDRPPVAAPPPPQPPPAQPFVPPPGYRKVADDPYGKEAMKAAAEALREQDKARAFGIPEEFMEMFGWGSSFFENFFGRRAGGSPPQGAAPPQPDVRHLQQAAALLGLTTWPVTAEQVKLAFRERAVLAHPDKQGGSDARMKQLLAARDLLQRHLGVT